MTLPIMTVIPQLGVGGAEAVAEAIVRDQLAAGARPTIASSGGFREAGLRQAGARVVPVRLASRRPLDLAASAWRLRRAAHRHRPVLIHAHNVKAALVARLAVGHAVPILVTVHGVPDREYAAAARLLHRCADRVVAVTPSVAERLQDAGLEPERVGVIENGVVPPRARSRAHARTVLGLPSDAVVTACLARMVPQKRHDLLLDAWRGLRTDAYLLLAGDGPTRRALERTVGPGDRIRFLGERSDVDTVLAASDLVTLATEWEGLPISLLEAMSAGLPVVVSDVAGLRATLGPAVRLVRPGSADELRRALDDLLASPGERAALARRGKRLVDDRFGQERMLAAYRAEATALVDCSRLAQAVGSWYGVGA